MKIVEERPLNGTEALVTGGSRGIGAAIVRRLAFPYVSSKDKAEALVAEVVSAGGVAVATHADSAAETDIRNAVTTALESPDAPDLFVNSAGQYRNSGITAFATEDLDRLPLLNVRAAVIGIQAALAGLVRGAASDLAPQAITVNNRQPGPTVTEENAAAGPRTDCLLDRIPLRRFERGAEVARLVAYLATRDAGFITDNGGYLA